MDNEHNDSKVNTLFNDISLKSYKYLTDVINNIEELVGSGASKITIDINRNTSGDNFKISANNNDISMEYSQFFTKPVIKVLKKAESNTPQVTEIFNTDNTTNIKSKFLPNTLKKIPVLIKMLNAGISINSIHENTKTSIKTIKKVINLYNIDYKESDSNQIDLFGEEKNSDGRFYVTNKDQIDFDKKKKSDKTIKDTSSISMELETQIVEDLIKGKVPLEIAMTRNIPSIEVENIEERYKDFIATRQNNTNPKPKSKEDKGRMLDDRIDMASKGLSM